MVRVYRATSGDYATGREQLDSARDSAYRLRYIAMRGDVISHKYKEARSLQIMPRAANSQSVSRSGTMIVNLVSQVFNFALIKKRG